MSPPHTKLKGAGTSQHPEQAPSPSLSASAQARSGPDSAGCGKQPEPHHIASNAGVPATGVNTHPTSRPSGRGPGREPVKRPCELRALLHGLRQPLPRGQSVLSVPAALSDPANSLAVTMAALLPDNPYIPTLGDYAPHVAFPANSHTVARTRPRASISTLVQAAGSPTSSTTPAAAAPVPGAVSMESALVRPEKTEERWGRPRGLRGRRVVWVSQMDKAMKCRVLKAPY